MLQDYQEYRGPVVKKRRTLFGKYCVLFRDEKRGDEGWADVGKSLFDALQPGEIWTAGIWRGQPLNLRPGRTQNRD